VTTLKKEIIMETHGCNECGKLIEFDSQLALELYCITGICRECEDEVYEEMYREEERNEFNSQR